MNYLAWLERLHQFVETWRVRLPIDQQHECSLRLDPPLSESELQTLRDSLDCPLPASVAAFLTQAASRVRCDCTCLVEGGKRLSAGVELFNYWFYRTEACEYDQEFDGVVDGMFISRTAAVDLATMNTYWLSEPEWVLDRALWRHALPLTRWPNTDGVALWVHDKDEAEPAVIWLAHDDRSYILSPNFDTFLDQMEYFGYTWDEEYINSETGIMSKSSAKAKKRRRLLGLEN